MIHLTPTAAQEIKRLQQSRGQHKSSFRLGVQAGGCAGLYYTLDLINEFAETDLEFESEGIAIAIPEAVAHYVQNLRVDYAEDLMGGGFRFSNPNASKTCSCSLSFQLDA
ncbi:iron-sulfur cluster assembly accessory protein [Synechocystis sp. LKSZ1]|uniref:HesB/IscA family protein n=1 Tax=Synechocystis sp. LKSZ1 TaxID=3144951 RepID=UPI00336C1A71